MIKWVRPSGNTIETGDTEEIIAYAVANGWEQVPPDIKADKPKPAPKQANQKAVKHDNSQANS